jgi:hypothetical protein
MSDQYRGSIKQRFAWEDVGGADIPQGLFTDFNEKYKAWEKRRGFSNETDFNGNAFGHNDKKPDPVKPLRGVVLRAKLALENKKKILLKNKSSGKFAPDIVGKRFASNSNAQRKIKKYTTENHAIIPADYEFGINKIDWGCYEITGNRIQIKK